jgi:hypothetical protein
MTRIAILPAAALLFLSGCFGTVTTTPGQSEPLTIAGYACTYRTDTTQVDVMLVPLDPTAEDFIACQNGEDYACGDRDRAACITHVEAILNAIPKEAPVAEA